MAEAAIQQHIPQPTAKAGRLDRTALRESYRMDENLAVARLLEFVNLSNGQKNNIKRMATDAVEVIRKTPMKSLGVESFLSEYGLNTKEGLALMSMAEALLRVPDGTTANALINDKLSSADWQLKSDRASDVLMTLSGWGLMLSGKVVKAGSVLKKLGEPVIREAMLQAMKILGKQFVMGQSIDDALKRAVDIEKKGFVHSYDMLGEGARTFKDAARYYDEYVTAIDAIGRQLDKRGDGRHTPQTSSGISVKLSALHPRYKMTHRDECVPDLVQKVKRLAMKCKDYKIGLTIDAEEADRLELSLDIIERVFLDPDLGQWDGFGVAIQAYQKRCFDLVDWLANLSQQGGRRLMVRLVKGAYWDSEIKWSQIAGLSEYPVYTRKTTTDLSYLACAIKLLARPDCFYAQFATHNAQTAATILELAGTEKTERQFEFQRLYGMGDVLHKYLLEQYKIPSRIYAPVGTYKDLLPYLVRRLLENGANSSFVNKVFDPSIPPENLLRDVHDYMSNQRDAAHPKIPLPKDIMEKGRVNSSGLELENPDELRDLLAEVDYQSTLTFESAPIIDGKTKFRKDIEREVCAPFNRDMPIGRVCPATEEDLEQAVAEAHKAYFAWDKTPVEDRAACLDRMADLLEKNRGRLIALCALEAGKTLQDGVDEVREAVDFCRYYARNARAEFGAAQTLPGPTGESNKISLHGRGVFLCISPWNFPLAIFLGQVTAALVSGNAVLAKPADQTSIIAYEAVKLLHQAGIPKNILHYIPARGSVIGQKLIPDERISGIVFTGSTGTAKTIQRSLAARDGTIIPFIAETGGQNAMIADSTALPEQIVDAVLRSSFLSAGQRCSALRVLYLQKDIADNVIAMIGGAMDALKIGDPRHAATDIGPVIDEKALTELNRHREQMRTAAKILHEMELGSVHQNGTFCAPTMIEIDNIDVLKQEHFGPILHIIRFGAKDLDKVIEQINSTGFGLTLGIQTRIQSRADYIAQRVKVGNIYVNRSMTGAVVGVQPFGGEGLSGTGPKAGGPRYLHRFAVERVVSIDTTASGGNASLVSLDDSFES